MIYKPLFEMEVDLIDAYDHLGIYSNSDKYNHCSAVANDMVWTCWACAYSGLI